MRFLIIGLALIALFWLIRASFRAWIVARAESYRVAQNHAPDEREPEPAKKQPIAETDVRDARFRDV